jgi:hypothetical protein
MSAQEKGLFDDEDDEGKLHTYSNPILTEYKPVELDNAAATGEAEANPYAVDYS